MCGIRLVGAYGASAYSRGILHPLVGFTALLSFPFWLLCPKKSGAFPIFLYFLSIPTLPQKIGEYQPLFAQKDGA